MKSLILGIALLSSPAWAQSLPSPGQVRVVDGLCDDRVTFACNSAVFSIHKGRGSLLISFVEKESSDEPKIVGYAGTLTDYENLVVERVYLAGKPFDATGTCQLFFNEHKNLTSVRCNAKTFYGPVPSVYFRVLYKRSAR